GDMKVYGTSGILPLRTWIDQFHRGLLLGDVGRIYSELAASWLWVAALGGLVLWAVRRRRQSRERGNVRRCR
ncbi:PepSY-associated TM helix, partial [Pseudomonas amygdali pv. morsprunorum str. M302280]|uniref:PepSY domain-containing protein n=1 Tax=Pseudomonas amygdali TaxID=47877 RepID=UPI000208BB6D